MKLGYKAIYKFPEHHIIKDNDGSPNSIYRIEINDQSINLKS